MDCERFRELLPDLADLDARQTEELEAHAAQCGRCAQALTAWRQAQEELRSLREEGFEPADSGPDPQQRLESAQRRERLAEGIAALPDEMRAALVLRDVEGHTYEEIAQMLDLAPGTVRSSVERSMSGAERIFFPENSFIKYCGRERISSIRTA